jgi:hypothetical protein
MHESLLEGLAGEGGFRIPARTDRLPYSLPLFIDLM